MPEIMKLIETGSLQQAVLASVDGLTATGTVPILSQTICFQAGDKSIVLDEKGLHYCGKLVGDADIAGAFKDYLHSSGVLSVGSAEHLLCIIPQLIQLCLEQGHAIRHLDEDSQYCELWSNDGGYVPDWGFSTARSLVIASRPELWPLEDRLPVEMWYIHAQGEDGEPRQAFPACARAPHCGVVFERRCHVSQVSIGIRALRIERDWIPGLSRPSRQGFNAARVRSLPGRLRRYRG